MRYDFSSQFLRVYPPETSCGDAWESLCYALTFADTQDSTLIRLRPPDCGIDFLSRGREVAYQCKSDERGSLGSMSAGPSIESLTSASNSTLSWKSYTFATNADYTGSALSKIEEAAQSLGIENARLLFLGPEHWDSLCQKYPAIAGERLDYRVTLSESQVIANLRTARYYETYVQEAESKLRAQKEEVVLSNNRTPIILSVPFSPELTIRQLLDVAKVALGLSLDWQNFFDIQTSSGPSLSITVDQVPLSFDKKIGDLTPIEKEKLQLWIKLVWSDDTKKDGEQLADRLYSLYRMPTVIALLCHTHSVAILRFREWTR